MTIASILVPIRGDGKGEHVLEHAMAVAARTGAHIDAVHCRPRAQDFLPFGVAVPAFMREQIAGSVDEATSQEEAHLHRLFDAFVARHRIAVIEPEARPLPGRPSIAWHRETGRQADILARRGRLADLVTLAQPDRQRNLGANSLHAALMETGRPVLMCPGAAPAADFARRIAVAWNGAREAARAVAGALPLLALAEQVTVITAGGAAEGPAAEALLRYLAMHGVAARAHSVADGGEVGADLLAGAAAAEADLLVMGGYGHSRGRETLLGGASQHVVDHAALPVLLAH